ncbi:MAG: chorismate mutase [Anaerolineales bacterium]
MKTHCRGIRGAVSVEANTPAAIDAAVRQLLTRIVAANEIESDDIASIIFTATLDLDAAYPARTARSLGWTHVPLLCMQEMAVTGSLPRCVRVLVHWNTERPPETIRHIYLGEARRLRPDLVEEGHL